jgi:hypothetical protein
VVEEEEVVVEKVEEKKMVEAAALADAPATTYSAFPPAGDKSVEGVGGERGCSDAIEAAALVAALASEHP